MQFVLVQICFKVFAFQKLILQSVTGQQGQLSELLRFFSSNWPFIENKPTHSFSYSMLGLVHCMPHFLQMVRSICARFGDTTTIVAADTVIAGHVLPQPLTHMWPCDQTQFNRWGAPVYRAGWEMWAISLALSSGVIADAETALTQLGWWCHLWHEATRMPSRWWGMNRMMHCGTY